MPPSPILAVTEYGPSVVPGSSGIVSVHVFSHLMVQPMEVPSYSLQLRVVVGLDAAFRSAFNCRMVAFAAPLLKPQTTAWWVRSKSR